MSETAFQIGDRVRLRDPERFIQPYRRLGQSRTATVTLYSTNHPSNPYKIEFDVKRKNADPVSMWVAGRELVPHPQQRQEGEGG